MEIEDSKMVLGNNINGACYVSDRFGGLIGWYDCNSRTLNVDERYKYIDSLIESCIDANFQIILGKIEEDEVLKYFAKRRIVIRKAIIAKKELNKKLDEQLKYLPSKRKVKNAAQKIRKRHG
jgi:hypothetical protein